jgi:hypothetical protein
MNSCPVRAPKATPFLAEGKPAEAPLAVRKDAGRRSRCPLITQTKNLAAATWPPELLGALLREQVGLTFSQRSSLL